MSGTYKHSINVNYIFYLVKTHYYKTFHSQYLPRSSIFNLVQAILAFSLNMPIFFIKLGRKVTFTVMKIPMQNNKWCNTTNSLTKMPYSTWICVITPLGRTNGKTIGLPRAIKTA